MEDGPLFPARWWWALLDLAIATFVATLAFQHVPVSLTHTLIGFGMALSLLLRRRAPLVAMALVYGLGLLQLTLTRELAPYDVAVLFTIAAAVTYGSVRQAYAVGAAVAAGLVFTWFVDTSTGDPLVFGLIVALGAVVWSVSLVLRQRKDAAELYAERAAAAERERDQLVKLAAAAERAAIARELHDVVAHSLAVMIVQADGATFVVEKDTGRARTALQTIAEIGRDALGDMHRIVAVMRGDSEEDASPTRRTGLDQLGVLAERARSSGVAVSLRVDADGIDAAEELTVVRLVQEGLTNVLRHAGAGTAVEVDVRARDDEVELSITDDGAGTPGGREVGGGNGLVGMRERVLLHGGRFSAGPVGGGWRVHAVLARRVLSR
ncbi:sensor histidine kinase [Lentzea sp. NPDC059081]|uniref:sensor histidine kinase n=1 Tax=Lentzea sp. NPDC059081 TaxID=3346719 RepID=UPI0036851E44